MKVNTSAWVIFILAGSVICVVLGASRAKDQSPQDKALALEKKEKTDGLSLVEYAELAKLKGRSSIVVPKSLSATHYAGFKDLKTASAAYTVLIARPVAAASYVEEGGVISTSYKFETLEKLSEPAPFKHQSTFNGELPSDLLPLGKDEFVVGVRGGTATVNGVAVTTRYGGYEPFSLFKRYLLFLDFDTTGRVGGMDMGPASALAINDDGTLETSDNRQHRIKREVDAQYNNSIDQLMTALRKNKDGN